MDSSENILIPGGAQTLSKAAHQFPENFPKTIERGEGAYVYDSDGNKYLDFICGLGPVILGHNVPCISEAVERRIAEGICFPLASTLEGNLADELLRRFSGYESVRFAKNGVDVTSAAVRLARHVTGRETILQFGYHGCSDWYLAGNELTRKGVPQCLWDKCVAIPKYDLAFAKEQFEKENIAAVIMEPFTYEMPGDPPDAYGVFRRGLRVLCRRYGALMIWDEVVSGFRHTYDWPQYEERPDIVCLGKAMGNGFPISAIIGKHEYMKHFDLGGVFFSHTFGGDLVGISAALAALPEIDKSMSHIESIAHVFQYNINLDHRDLIMGKPPRLFWNIPRETLAIIQQEAIKQGIMFGVPIFFNAAMIGEDIVRAVNIVVDIYSKIKAGTVKLEGRPPREVLKRK